MRKKIRDDLRNGKSIDDVCRDYNISFKNVVEMMKEPEYVKKMLPENIIMKNRMYSVCNVIDGEIVFFGRFRTLHQAKAVLEKLVASDWSLRPYEYLGMMHIYGHKGKWRLQKQFSNNSQWRMTFENKEDAIFVRDELVLCDWDLSCLPEILEKVECEGSGSYYKW